MYSAFNPHNVSHHFWDTQVAKITNLEVTDFKLKYKTRLQALGGKGGWAHPHPMGKAALW